MIRFYFFSILRSKESSECFINKKYYFLNFVKMGILVILINFIFLLNDKFNYKVGIYYRYLFLFNVLF